MEPLVTHHKRTEMSGLDVLFDISPGNVLIKQWVEGDFKHRETHVTSL